jgi:3,4-dihydroxy 2-butanone 4-phosphate synthase/GTP cyclohydrolase II
MSDLLPFETPGAVERDLAEVISPIEQIIDDARNGRMFVLVDHEDRENEGDLVIPAQMATPEAINFMARYGRGLICLAMTSERTDALGLQLMSSYNSSRHETAFTISIEAREGVTTGISAPIRLRLRLMLAKLPQISPRPVMCFPCVPVMAASWCARAIRRRPLISHVWLD